MILADKIILLRKRNGWSQEELAERLDVSRQAVSKWEGGLSVPDLNKIIGMSTLFGVSTDYLLKDSLEEITPSETQDTDDPTAYRSVCAEEANRYLATVRRVSHRIALGVMLCMLSPVCLLLLLGFAENPSFFMTEPLATTVGLITLLLFVAGAVAIFVPNGLLLSEFSYLEQERISLEYGVQGIVEKQRTEYAPQFRTRVTVGVLLCILSVLPLLALSVLGVADWTLPVALGGVLVICSVGVFIVVQACHINGSYQRLLQTGDYTAEKKSRNKKGGVLDAVQSAYWGIVTALYFVISFATGAWHLTWIIWVVAGCLDPLLDVIFQNRERK